MTVQVGEEYAGRTVVERIDGGRVVLECARGHRAIKPSSASYLTDRCRRCFSSAKAKPAKKHLRKRGSITHEQFEEMCAAQKHSCAICGVLFGQSTKDRACLDHCHASGKLRGALCAACNLMLGHANDSAATLTKAIEYLRRYE